MITHQLFSFILLITLDGIIPSMNHNIEISMTVMHILYIKYIHIILTHYF